MVTLGFNNILHLALFKLSKSFFTCVSNSKRVLLSISNCGDNIFRINGRMK